MFFSARARQVSICIFALFTVSIAPAHGDILGNLDEFPTPTPTPRTSDGQYWDDPCTQRGATRQTSEDRSFNGTACSARNCQNQLVTVTPRIPRVLVRKFTCSVDPEVGRLSWRQTCH